MRLNAKAANHQNFLARIRPLSSLSRSATISGLAIASFILSIQPAMAHHAMDGKTPTNFAQGFLSGLAHPVIGVDHLAFVVAIGLLAAVTTQGIMLIPAFLLAAACGTGVHLLSLDLPAPEILISLSVIALGALLVWNQKLPISILLGLAAFAGLFHGYAYGEAIIGAEATSTMAYLLGFTAIQLIIALLAKTAGEWATRVTQSTTSWSRLSGGAICLVGTVFLASAIAG
jgi:urease accessory protein